MHLWAFAKKKRERELFWFISAIEFYDFILVKFEKCHIFSTFCLLFYYYFAIFFMIRKIIFL